MISLFSIFRSTSSLLCEYDRYRDIQRKLHSIMLDECMSDGAVLLVAQELGIIEQGMMVLESEEEWNLVNDYMLYEAEWNHGRTFVEYFSEEHTVTEDAEAQMLLAMTKAKASLFLIVSTDPQSSTLILRDELNGEEGIVLIDRGMSVSASPGAPLFTRLTRFPLFAMTSGASFPFPIDERADLLSICSRIACKNLGEKTKSRRIFRKIFHLHRTRGVPFITGTSAKI